MPRPVTDLPAVALARPVTDLPAVALARPVTDLPAVALARPVTDLPALALARPVTDLPAVALARACLISGVPLTLLLDLAAGERLDSAEILAVEAAAALARPECVAAASPGRGVHLPPYGDEVAGTGHSDIA
jgi:hypothetical protein